MDLVGFQVNFESNGTFYNFSFGDMVQFVYASPDDNYSKWNCEYTYVGKIKGYYKYEHSDILYMENCELGKNPNKLNRSGFDVKRIKKIILID